MYARYLRHRTGAFYAVRREFVFASLAFEFVLPINSFILLLIEYIYYVPRLGLCFYTLFYPRLSPNPYVEV